MVAFQATPVNLLILFGAGVVASAINVVAGGGSLVSFPTLMGFGLPSREANATNSVALWPGALAGAIGFVNQIAKTKKHLGLLMIPTVLGSIAGAFLLFKTSKEAFDAIVPLLVLTATILLACQKRIRSWSATKHSHINPLFGAFLQLIVAIYGGYFGAGMGILMLAVMGLFIDANIHELNAIKNWLGLVINFAASVVFLTQGLVILVPGLALMAGSIVGGYFGARMSQKVDSEKLRKVIVVYGFVMCGWFTYKLIVK